MENKERPPKWEQEKGIYSVCYGEGGSHYHLDLAESKAGRRVRTLYNGEKKKKDGFRYALIGCCWHRAVVGGLIRSWVS